MTQTIKTVIKKSVEDSVKTYNNLESKFDSGKQGSRSAIEQIFGDFWGLLGGLSTFRPWRPLTWPSMYKLVGLLVLASLYKLLHQFGVTMKIIPPPTDTFLYSLLVINLIKAQAFLNERYETLKIFQRGNVPFVRDPSPFSGNLFELIVPDNNIVLLQEQHEKLGKTYGMFYGPAPWVFTIDLELIRRIFVTEGAKFIDATQMRLPFAAEVNESLSQVQGNRWRRLRRLLNPSFCHRQMKTDNVYLDITKTCDLVIDCIANHPVEEVRFKKSDPDVGERCRLVDVYLLFTKFTIEIFFRIAFGLERCTKFEPNETDDVIRSIREGGRLVKGPLVWTSIMFEETSGLIGYLGQFTELGRLREFVHSVLNESLERRRERTKNYVDEQSTKINDKVGSGISDGIEANGLQGVAATNATPRLHDRKMIDTIIEIFDSHKMDETSLRANLFFLFIAGFETTSTTLTILFWFLAKHKKVQEKLHEELLLEGENSKYLDKCIKETLRLYPAVPSGVGRVINETLQHEDMTFFPGTSINPNIFALHRSREIWGEDVLEFKPERWDEPNNMHPMQYFAFAFGPRNCIGMNFAKAEIRALATRILLKYRVEPCPGKTIEQIDICTPNLIHWILDDVLLNLIELAPA